MRITLDDGGVCLTIERPGAGTTIHAVLVGLVVPALLGLGYDQDLVADMFSENYDPDQGYAELTL